MICYLLGFLRKKHQSCHHCWGILWPYFCYRSLSATPAHSRVHSTIGPCGHVWSKKKLPRFLCFFGGVGLGSFFPCFSGRLKTRCVGTLKCQKCVGFMLPVNTEFWHIPSYTYTVGDFILPQNSGNWKLREPLWNWADGSGFEIGNIGFFCFVYIPQSQVTHLRFVCLAGVSSEISIGAVSGRSGRDGRSRESLWDWSTEIAFKICSDDRSTPKKGSKKL